MIDLTPQQVRNAAQAGVTLLNTPGAVNVPSTMSITGVTQVLHAVLLGIAEGRLMVIDLSKKEPEASAEEPNKEVADAVAAAVDSSGNSEKAPSEERAGK